MMSLYFHSNRLLVGDDSLMRLFHLSTGCIPALQQRFQKLCTWRPLSLCTDQQPEECPANTETHTQDGTIILLH